MNTQRAKANNFDQFGNCVWLTDFITVLSWLAFFHYGEIILGESESRGAPEKVPLEKINDYMWRIPQYKQAMRVPGMVFANEFL